ncbi:hypothetical protein GKQ38_01000 [Candidatus Nanohaloarchaea archaeon]|nr:hypothetical protein GKQ38_01000 [Candidatus Nanohaloarchaea archaeon]
MAVAIVELKNDVNLGRNATVQLEEMGVNSNTYTVDQLMDLPGEVARRLEEADAVIALADMTDSNYISEAVSQIIKIDAGTEKPVAKVLDEKGVRDRHTYQRELKSLTNERAERLAREIN